MPEVAPSSGSARGTSFVRTVRTFSAEASKRGEQGGRPQGCRQGRVGGAEREDGAGESRAGDGQAAGKELVLRRCGGVLNGGAMVADRCGHLRQRVEAVTGCRPWLPLPRLVTS